MTDFFERYAEALDAYLTAGDEAALSIGHELGRRVLTEKISVLEIIENHARLLATRQTPADSSVALQFLLQTLAAVDVATRGFLDGTKRYEQQRARARNLAERDEFRSALVNSLQEGFFVADHTGAIVEINDAFVDITGYGPADLPYHPPYPWVGDEGEADTRLSALQRDGYITADVQIRHRDGTLRWAAISINAVTSEAAERRMYVGTIRDITATRAAAVRERTVARLATAVSVARSVDEVLTITLAQCRSTLDAQRLIAVVWPPEGVPAVHVAGEPAVSGWDDLDPDWQRTFDDARDWLPLTVTPVGAAPSAGTTRGFVAMLTGARDVAVCVEHRVPRRISESDRQLITAIVGHLSLAMQHVRQFETARETSLTLQRSMLPPSPLPPGFAVRYEPAVPPLEVGGDFYDVVPVGENRIGVIVGDCVGRGLSAAAVMGQLRASTRALLLAGAQPATVLEQLDSVAEFIPDAFCTTVFVAVLDIEAQTVDYSSAGHVPPLLSDGTSAPERLTDAVSVPLAVHREAPRPQASRPLAPGAALLLYTDGLVERRDEAIDEQIDRVAQVLWQTVDQPVESAADAILGGLAPETGYDDDVAVVLYRHADSPAFTAEYEATAQQLSNVRHGLGEWLRANELPEQLIADVILVVNEACTNSVEHAYRDASPGPMRVSADIDGDRLQVRVTDFGSWKSPPADPGTRGKGLLLIREVGDDVVLDGTPDGTAVAATFNMP